MDPYTVIIRPIDTEKTRYQGGELRQYTFAVDRRANKIEVKRAIESIFGVTVEAVNIVNMPAKITRRWGRRRIVRALAWKKAIVTLAKGQQLELFEGV